MKPLLVIFGGPTGVGKTQVAVETARHFQTEIVSADSRQLFKEMSIGTAVPSAHELALVKHHFIRSVSICEPYNASIYEQQAVELLDSLFGTYPIVVMVGGSGMYIDAVCNGIDDIPSVSAPVRKKYKEIYDDEGIESLCSRLSVVDPEYFAKVDKMNPKRIQKALEVWEESGKPYSSFLTNRVKSRNFNILKIILNIPREELYTRINLRVDQMVSAGLEDEARIVFALRNLTPLKTVGYREFFDYFDGKISRDEAITQVKNHSRAYARRQITWFRKYNDAHWFKPDQTTEIVNLIQVTYVANR